MAVSINIGSGGQDRGFGRRHRRSRPATPLGTLIAGVLIMAVSPGVYFAMESQAERIRHVLSEGETAEATVERMRESERPRTDTDGNRRRETDYFISFRYQTADGREQQINDRRVSQSIYRSLSPGDSNTIQVAYLPNEPGDPIFPEHESGESNSWVSYLIGLLGAILAFFGFTGWQRQRKQGASRSVEPQEEAPPELRPQDESQEV